jgi:glutamyl-Q tRNA(Asp) synthetase
VIAKITTGRFAPSPSGDLHFGSLVSALGSYLAAKSRGGQWLIRIEDLDPPREVAGSAQRILQDLQTLGLTANAAVLYQSKRHNAYQNAVNRLLEAGQAYHCGCSRKDLPDSGIYPGTCRNGIAKGKKPRAVRFLITQQTCNFDDLVQGPISERMSCDSGDFVIKRADGLFAYHLASVIDDHHQQITQVVRGADLLDSTSKQICLQRALGFATPEYMHLPVVLGAGGKKLSKREQSDPLRNLDPADCLTSALRFLGQQPPANLTLQRLLAWAIEYWDESLIPHQPSIFPAKV